jgi:hypothetical protein
VSTRNGEQAPSAGSAVRDPSAFEPPTESLATPTGDGAADGAVAFNGPAPDSASTGSGMAARAGGFLQDLEPQQALGLAMGGGILSALLLRWIRFR